MEGIIEEKTLHEWLLEYPQGPYEVGLYTVKTGEDPGEYTAGRVVFRADRAVVEGSGVLFLQGMKGEIAFIGSAFGGPEAGVLDGRPFWRASYANLTVPVEGFYPEVVVTVTKL